MIHRAQDPLTVFIPFAAAHLVLVWLCYGVHRHEANYRQVVHVDYDYEDYFRFGRVEKQLAN